MSKPNKIFYEKPQHLQDQTKSNENYHQYRLNLEKMQPVMKEEPKEEPYMSQSQIEEQYFQPSYQTMDYNQSSNVKSSAGSKIKSWIANGVMIVLSVIFVISTAVAIGQISDMNRAWTRDEDDFWYYISDGYYSDTVSAAYHNRNEGVIATRGLEQCYAVAEYFEAASLYKVAVQAGDQEDIEKYAAKMEESLQYMDDILHIAEDINMKLGIE